MKRSEYASMKRRQEEKVPFASTDGWFVSCSNFQLGCVIVTDGWHYLFYEPDIALVHVDVACRMDGCVVHMQNQSGTFCVAQRPDLWSPTYKSTQKSKESEMSYRRLSATTVPNVQEFDKIVWVARHASWQRQRSALSAHRFQRFHAYTRKVLPILTLSCLVFCFFVSQKSRVSPSFFLQETVTACFGCWIFVQRIPNATRDSRSTAPCTSVRA
jgi:hypothetical protein